MKKQLAILFLSTAILSGCHHLCDECADGRCNTTPVAPVVVTQKMVLDRTSHFAFDSAVLSSEAKHSLTPVVDRLEQNPSEHVMIKGYTDSTGSAAYNQTLSERRAMAVKDYLVSEGIAANRISTHGYGATDFVATNATAEGRAQNRRTEIVCHK